ncbi:MAG: hypothetical protein ACLR7U_14185 [Ruthenibacterium lactatiformans]
MVCSTAPALTPVGRRNKGHRRPPRPAAWLGARRGGHDFGGQAVKIIAGIAEE